MKCSITGSSGFVGGEILQHFLGCGWEVLALGRQPHPATPFFAPYQLEEPCPALPWKEIDLLVHCAWDMRLRSWPEMKRINVDGSIRLFRSAKENGLKRLVFISSFSSFDGCRSLYGRAKRLVEEEALRCGFTVIRPGLVYGDASGGIMGAMSKALRMSPIVPMIGHGEFVQFPVHVHDLARFVYAVGSRSQWPAEKPLSAAPNQAVPFCELLEVMAERAGRKPWFFPIPWRLIDRSLWLVEALGIPFPFRRDSLTGLVFSNPTPDFELPPDLPFTFRPFRE